MDPTTEVILATFFVVGVIIAPECVVGLLWIFRAGTSSEEESRLRVMVTVVLISALSVVYLGGMWLCDVYVIWFDAFRNAYPGIS